MTIHVYTLCWNEIDLAPFFFRHYAFADRVVVYDNLSSDGSAEYAAARGAEVIPYDSGGEVREDLCLAIKNDAWKASRGRADWVIVVDFDEFIYSPDVVNYLARCTRLGVTVPLVAGYQMVSGCFPDVGTPLTDQVRTGIPSPGMSKPAVFAPDAIVEINYRPGAHTAAPVGRVVASAGRELHLLHYSALGLPSTLRRHRSRQERLSEATVRSGWWSHYLRRPEEVAANFSRRLAAAAPVIPPLTLL